jgi:hypothetical protein
MNDQSHEREPHTQPIQESGLAQTVSGLERRQLLRAVGAGGVLAGAGFPMAAHATGRPYCTKSSKNYHATASAVGSMVGSVGSGTPPIYGHTCSHYRSAGNWPSSCTNGKGRTLTYNTCANTTYTGTKLKFWHCFEQSDPGPGSPKSRYCADILANYPTSEEAHWLTALFNANKCNPFAYSAGQVVDLCAGRNPLMGGQTQADIANKALTLFRDYLSSVA